MRLGTSIRARPAAETAAVARRLMRRLGISGLVDITSLDKLGLPVCISLRPAGLAARLHAGKGVSTADARVGALMEAVECAAAEQASADSAYKRLPLAELAARLPGNLVLNDFSPRLGHALETSRTTTAARCDDIVSGRRCWLPADLVMVPSPEEGAPPLFGWSTNGLASGSTLQEATLHALLEVLERDTIAMSTARSDGVRVDPQSLPEPFAARAAQWQRLGVQLFVRHLPGDFGLPCVEATLCEPGHAQAELARGWGLHPDRRVALSRAICEAAQARLCQIHASQPGMAALYGARVRPDSEASAEARARLIGDLAATPVAVTFDDLPNAEHRSVRAALQAVLARLAARGFHHVFRRRMRIGNDDTALLGLHVVKIIVPRCETLMGRGGRVGPRLRDAVLARR